jgi:hypothetical protein
MSLSDLAIGAWVRLTAAAGRLATRRWATPADAERLRRCLEEARSLVRRVAGASPSFGDIPMFPRVRFRPDPGDRAAAIVHDSGTGRMWLTCNYAMGRDDPRVATLVLAHEAAHVLHEQARGDLAADILLAEKFAFAVTIECASLIRGRVGTPRDEPADDVHAAANRWASSMSSPERLDFIRRHLLGSETPPCDAVPYAEIHRSESPE